MSYELRGEGRVWEVSEGRAIVAFRVQRGDEVIRRAMPCLERHAPAYFVGARASTNAELELVPAKN